MGDRLGIAEGRPRGPAALQAEVDVIILGGIYSGIFTPTESAAVAAFVALVVGMMQGRIGLADFPAMLGASARVCGVVLPIIAVALLFAQALTVVDVPQAFVSGMMSVAGSIPLVDEKSAVIANDGALKVGTQVARSAAHYLQMAIKNKAGGAVDPHAGHNH